MNTNIQYSGIYLSIRQTKAAPVGKCEKTKLTEVLLNAAFQTAAACTFQCDVCVQKAASLRLQMKGESMWLPSVTPAEDGRCKSESEGESSNKAG